MEKDMRFINDMLGQLYQEKRLRNCITETVSMQKERIRILHNIVMNVDRLTGSEIQEQAYCYGKLIQEDELLARQIFLCLLQLADNESV